MSFRKQDISDGDYFGQFIKRVRPIVEVIAFIIVPLTVYIMIQVSRIDAMEKVSSAQDKRIDDTRADLSGQMIRSRQELMDGLNRIDTKVDEANTRLGRVEGQLKRERK